MCWCESGNDCSHFATTRRAATLLRRSTGTKGKNQGPKCMVRLQPGQSWRLLSSAVWTDVQNSFSSHFYGVCSWKHPTNPFTHSVTQVLNAECSYFLSLQGDVLLVVFSVFTEKSSQCATQGCLLPALPLALSTSTLGWAGWLLVDSQALPPSTHISAACPLFAPSSSPAVASAPWMGDDGSGGWMNEKVNSEEPPDGNQGAKRDKEQNCQQGKCPNSRWKSNPSSSKSSVSPTSQSSGWLL